MTKHPPIPRDVRAAVFAAQRAVRERYHVPINDAWKRDDMPLFNALGQEQGAALDAARDDAVAGFAQKWMPWA